MQTTLRMVSASAEAPRDPSNKDTDAAALRAIAQAAVEVELFTIPLYMTSLYSIQGMHQITGSGNAFYQGRLWPGPKTTAQPKTANEKAFNIIFSVFIQEMLHLQLAANMATTINENGAQPDFTSAALMNQNHGWTCYGPNLTVIPHIIDLQDTIHQTHVKVNIGALSREQLQLFLAIEQPDHIARADIQEDKKKKYFPKTPFEKWKPGDPLPMFGTIGYMYQCYFDYLNLKYSDGSRLWDAVFTQKGQQNDEFNSFAGPGHPMREFMGFEASVAQTYPDIAFKQMGLMMDAITDQGEGSTLVEKLRLAAREGGLQATKPQYQASIEALRSDYPSFSDTGKLLPSADAVARGDNDIHDHYECFQEILRRYVDEVVTWPAWLAKHGPWTAKDLTTADYKPNPKIPPPEDVAAALNLLAKPPPGAPDYYKLLSQTSVGSIAGVTTVLNNFWSAAAQSLSPVPFPFPSMSGSGDRMAICWAIFGKAPDLSIGLDAPVSGKLYHSCQGIDYNATGGDIGKNSCAEVAVFHTCRGSNGCHAQGGCGFVQLTSGGGNCSSSMSTANAGDTRTFGDPSRCSPPQGPNLTIGGCNPFTKFYSAPGDNKCATFGGCAVPISASQVFPKDGWMSLFKFELVNKKWTSVDLNETVQFNVGDNVHDIAWQAYFKVMQPDGTVPPPPKSTPLRLAFPPST